jgi:hypothetical protein
MQVTVAEWIAIVVFATIVRGLGSHLRDRTSAFAIPPSLRRRSRG